MFTESKEMKEKEEARRNASEPQKKKQRLNPPPNFVNDAPLQVVPPINTKLPKPANAQDDDEEDYIDIEFSDDEKELEEADDYGNIMAAFDEDFVPRGPQEKPSRIRRGGRVF